MNDLQNRIIKLKKEKRALILAHYYQTLDIQEIADVVGDSFEMARQAREAQENLLVVCGVHFMAESAKILSPQKTVLLPMKSAGCPMADMITAKDITDMRDRHPNAAVVCYVNTSAQIKAVSDVCCTSSSAEKIVRALPQKQIIFVPDRNLGAYIASRVPEKEIILFEGYCPIHDRVTKDIVIAAKSAHPSAKLLAHPECRPEVLDLSDFIGSTTGIINEALTSEASEFIIGTESEIVERLKTLAPSKTFYPLASGFLCPDMKKTKLSDVLRALEEGDYEISLYEKVSAAAGNSLELMVSLGAVK